MEEALSNAFKHGNKHDPGKRAWVRCWVDGQRVLVEVEDEGAGFDAADIPEPTGPGDLECLSERGLGLMRHFTTWLRFNQRGNRVQLCKLRV
jgi:serine/threonine-protein kinase RsbW